MSNIFNIFYNQQASMPFVVRRENWELTKGLLVVRVWVTEQGKLRGTAWGFVLPPLDGAPMRERYGDPDNPVEIPNSNGWCWKLIKTPMLPAEWIKIIRDSFIPAFEKVKDLPENPMPRYSRQLHGPTAKGISYPSDTQKAEWHLNRLFPNTEKVLN